MREPACSIILPFYRQSDHVERIYDTYTRQLDQMPYSWELIFVLNGRDDGTRSILERKCDRDNIVIESLEQGGWGRAVRHGLSIAKGNYLCYTNTARTDIEDLTAMLDLAMISRDSVVKATRLIRESWIRRLGSTLYNIQFRLLFRYPIWDVNGTPKVLPRKVYDQIPITRDDDLIDAEIIANCSKFQVRLIEVPVRTTHRMSGKSTTNMMSALRLFRGLFKLRADI